MDSLGVRRDAEGEEGDQQKHHGHHVVNEVPDKGGGPEGVGAYTRDKLKSINWIEGLAIYNDAFISVYERCMTV